MVHDLKSMSGYSAPMLERARSIRGVATLIEAGRNFARDRGSRMAAAVSYRTIFALAPLLLIAVSVFGAFVGGSDEAQRNILATVEEFAGAQIASALELFMFSAAQSSGLAALVGFALFFWTSSTLFMEVQNSLNDVFEVPYEETAGLKGFIVRRVVGFGWALGLGLLLVAVWMLNVAWTWVGNLFAPNLSWLHSLLMFLTPVVSLVLFPLIFALSFWSMTHVHLSWKAIWKGGFFTSAVFVLTALGARFYFDWDSDTSAPQLAAGFFVILLLAFFLSSAYLFGAQMTKVYNDRIRGT